MSHSAQMMRLLVIDDDAAPIADETAIGPSGAQVTIVRDAEVGRRLAGQRDFDAILLNIAMPGGRGLIERLAADAPDAALVAISARGLDGHTLEHTLTLAELHGAVASYPKPIDLAELAATGRLARRKGRASTRVKEKAAA